MKFAMVHDGTVKEIAYLYSYERKKYKNAVPTGDYAVRVGDIWDGTHFYHDNEKVLTLEQDYYRELQKILKAFSLIGVPISKDGTISIRSKEIEIPRKTQFWEEKFKEEAEKKGEETKETSNEDSNVSNKAPAATLETSPESTSKE